MTCLSTWEATFYHISLQNYFATQGTVHDFTPFKLMGDLLTHLLLCPRLVVIYYLYVFMCLFMICCISCSGANCKVLVLEKVSGCETCLGTIF